MNHPLWVPSVSEALEQLANEIIEGDQAMEDAFVCTITEVENGFIIDAHGQRFIANTMENVGKELVDAFSLHEARRDGELAD